MLRKIIFTLALLFVFTPALAQEKPEIPDSVKTCLTKNVGEANFQAVLDGTRGPTPDEIALAEKGGCFENFNPQIKPPANRPEVPADFRSCAQKAIQDKSRAKLIIEEGAQATGDERAAIQKSCFEGKNKPPIDIDNEAFECAKNKMGGETFNKALENGGADLSEEKRAEIDKECFKGKFKRGEGQLGNPPEFSDKTAACLKEKGIETAQLRQMFESQQEPPVEIREKMFSCFEDGDKRGGPPGGGFQAPEEFLTCIKTEFGVDPKELGERFGPDKRPSSDDEAKMQKCQKEHNFQPGGGPNGPGGPGPEHQLPEKVKACLAEKFGIPESEVQTKRFEEGDHEKAQQCFQEFGDRKGEAGEGFRPPDGFIKCVQEKFGVSEKDLGDRFGPNKQPSEEDKAKLDECQGEHKFEAPSGEGQQNHPKPPELSADVKNCLGDDLYKRAFEGQGQISEEDKKAVGTCFQKSGPPQGEQQQGAQPPQGQFGPPPQGQQGTPPPNQQFGPPPNQQGQPPQGQTFGPPPTTAQDECVKQAATEEARKACFAR